MNKKKRNKSKKKTVKSKSNSCTSKLYETSLLKSTNQTDITNFDETNKKNNKTQIKQIEESLFIEVSELSSTSDNTSESEDQSNSLSFETKQRPKCSSVVHKYEIVETAKAQHKKEENCACGKTQTASLIPKKISKKPVFSLRPQSNPNLRFTLKKNTSK